MSRSLLLTTGSRTAPEPPRSLCLSAPPPTHLALPVTPVSCSVRSFPVVSPAVPACPWRASCPLRCWAAARITWAGCVRWRPQAGRAGRPRSAASGRRERRAGSRAETRTAAGLPTAATGTTEAEAARGAGSRSSRRGRAGATGTETTSGEEREAARAASGPGRNAESSAEGMRRRAGENSSRSPSGAASAQAAAERAMEASAPYYSLITLLSPRLSSLLLSLLAASR